MFGFKRKRPEPIPSDDYAIRFGTACFNFCYGASIGTLESKNLGWFIHERLAHRQAFLTTPLRYVIEGLDGPKMSDSMSDWCRSYLEHESPEVRLERLAGAVADYSAALENQANQEIQANLDAAGHVSGQDAVDMGVEQRLSEVKRLAELERTQEP